jgi:hypothetical protein
MATMLYKRRKELMSMTPILDRITVSMLACHLLLAGDRSSILRQEAFFRVHLNLS